MVYQLSRVGAFRLIAFARPARPERPPGGTLWGVLCVGSGSAVPVAVSLVPFAFGLLVADGAGAFDAPAESVTCATQRAGIEKSVNVAASKKHGKKFFERLVIFVISVDSCSCLVIAGKTSVKEAFREIFSGNLCVLDSAMKFSVP